jgi:hypothetical protein
MTKTGLLPEACQIEGELSHLKLNETFQREVRKRKRQKKSASLQQFQLQEHWQKRKKKSPTITRLEVAQKTKEVQQKRKHASP